MTAVRIQSREFSRLRVAVPGSKSVANRALICAAMAHGASTLSNVPDGDDTRMMIEGLRTLGCSIAVDGDVVRISPGRPTTAQTVWCGLAGTTSRFLTAFSAIVGHEVVIDGEERLRRRPMRDLHDALRQLGVRVRYLGVENFLPVAISAPRTLQHEVRMRGDVSSQFISALMLVGPVLNGLTISLTSELVSRPYVDMTKKVMSDFGVKANLHGRDIVVPDAQYAAVEMTVEPDYSSAAFAVALGVITGKEVVIEKLGLSTMQGDSFILDIARLMGAQVAERGVDVVVSREPGSPLRSISVNLETCSDLVPIVAVMALLADGDSILEGIGFIREKESNRLDDLASELRKLGADITVMSDGLVIHGGRVLRPASLSVHDDHRLAMAFAILACVVPGIHIDEADVVTKSWPGFWSAMEPVLFREEV